MKSGFVISVIGRQQSGKTPYVKKLHEASKDKFLNSAVYDIYGEYDKSKFSVFTDEDFFKEKLISLSHSFIVVEEATTFVSAFKDMDWAKICVGIAHRNNICVFVFHTLSDAPKSILNKSRYIYLFPTLDDPNDVKNSRSRFYPYFIRPANEKPILIDNYRI